MKEFALRPQPDDPSLTERVTGTDQNGDPLDTHVVVERPLTLFLNRQEIVTMMTICDYPDYLAVGYLVNQNMLDPREKITSIDYEEDIETVVQKYYHINIGEDNFEYLGSPDHKRWMSIKGEKPADENQDAA